jgi:hypothetical protein
MKTKLSVLSLFIMILTGCNRLESGLTVQPGKQFELGGNQNGSFTVKTKNIGDVAVLITERQATGQTIALGKFVPGQQQTIRFAAGSSVLIDNSSTSAAQLKLIVTGDKNLSMREKTP